MDKDVSAEPVTVTRGDGPIILGMPHAGLGAPADILEDLNDEGRLLRDADWRVDRLYEGLLARATTVKANFHRYVIDANRDPSGASLYPGQNTTSLVPLTNFDGAPVWRREPDELELERRTHFHRAYHQALSAEIDRVRRAHGVAILYDCHSIRSKIPHLFDGRLPDLNIGTNGGTTCAPAVERCVVEIASKSRFSHVVNGRFRGGWTTRRYGQPASGVHAVQMELAQSLYLECEAPPFAYDQDRAEELRDVLRKILLQLELIAPTLGTQG